MKVLASLILVAAAIAVGRVPAGPMAETYTATPCGTSSGETYEVFASLADQIGEEELLAVKITSDPATYRCCTVDRTQVNNTPREEAKLCVGSGYTLDQCFDCILYWEAPPTVVGSER